MPDSRLKTVWGTSNANAKLTEDDIKELRYLWKAHKHLSCKARKALGVTVPALAEEYGVHKGTISRALRGKNWAHVPPLDETW